MAEDTYTVQRSTTIDAPPERIYAQIVDFHEWTAWSPWEDIDPDLSRSYSGPDSGTGATYAWSGNRKAGQGRMQITDAVAPSTVRIDLVFEQPFKGHNETVFSIRPDGSGSLVTWTMTGRKTLMTKIMGIFVTMEKFLGPDFEKGLARLKVSSENRP
jgi:uncharacterized protein YndB with AHSA1/START domain